MSKLEQAMEQAHTRKQLIGQGQQGIVFSDGKFEDRAVFSGFDLEYDELVSTSTNIADLYCQMANLMGLRSLFISSWCDGLLTGMLLASLPPEPLDPGATDGTGMEGGL